MISNIHDVEAALPSIGFIDSAKEWVNGFYAIDSDPKAWTWLRGVKLNCLDMFSSSAALLMVSYPVEHVYSDQPGDPSIWDIQKVAYFPYVVSLTHIAIAILNFSSGEAKVAAKELAVGLVGISASLLSGPGITFLTRGAVLCSFSAELLLFLVPSAGHYARSVRFSVLDWSDKQVSLIEGRPHEAGISAKRWTLQPMGDRLIEGVVAWTLLWFVAPAEQRIVN